MSGLRSVLLLIYCYLEDQMYYELFASTFGATYILHSQNQRGGEIGTDASSRFAPTSSEDPFDVSLCTLVLCGRATPTCEYIDSAIYENS
jgi:hypothetical protein